LSHDHGRQIVRHQPQGRAGRPALDRPSLFAGQDAQNSVLDDDDTQRVRILSTLESARRPVRVAPSKARRQRRQGAGSWQFKALIGLMSVGVIALLTSFVMVVVDGHANSARLEAPMVEQAAKSGQMPAQPAAPARHTDQRNTKAAPAGADNPLAALITPPASTAAKPEAKVAQAEPRATSRPAAEASPQTAVIETVSTPAPLPKTAPIAAAFASAATPLAPRAVSASASAAETPSAGTTAKAPARSAMASANEAKSTAPAASKPPVDTLAIQRALNVPPAAGGKSARNARNDEDVALLEAMFAHTGARKPPVSVAEEIKRQCSQLAGAEAATCRARLCVQNPSANVCHPEP
jgi:hypothetical protein